MPVKLNWTPQRDTRLKQMRSEAANWDMIAAALAISRNAAMERGRRVGARLPPAEHVAPPDDPDRAPLPAGHPASWGAIVAGTQLDGAAYNRRHDMTSPPDAATVRAAAWFAPLLVRGLVDAGEALDALLAASRRALPHLDPAGRRARLSHALNDAASDLARGRQAAVGRVCAAIRPLLECWAPASHILAAALSVEGAGHLDAAEIDDLIEAAMHHRLASGRLACGRPAWARR